MLSGRFDCLIIELNVILHRLNDRLVVVLAELEILLPLYWNTSTRHYLLYMALTVAIFD